jgi:Protein of unknown function (DUF2786)/SprT-like family
MTVADANQIRHWTHRLRDEFDHVCFTYRQKLKRPVIKVAPLLSRWAQWEGDIRTLSIAEKLLSDFPWDIVVEVLKHEMAHQKVDEEYGADEVHGPLFQRACRELGVAAWACKSEVDLVETKLSELRESWKEQKVGTQEERLLSRVEKLLRLANSSNSHESIAAMKKVQELYLKYQLDRLPVATKDDYVYLPIRLGKRRVDRYQSAIATLLQDFFRVDVIHTQEYDSDKNANFKVIEILGRKENVLLAEYVFYFLTNQLPELWKRHDGKKDLKRRNSFYLGVLAGFRENLESNEKAVLSNDKALALVLAKKDPALDNFLAYRYPRLVKISHGRLMQDGRSFEAGKSEGRKLVLKKGIESKSQNLGRFLPK